MRNREELPLKNVYVTLYLKVKDGMYSPKLRNKPRVSTCTTLFIILDVLANTVWQQN